MRKKNLLSIFIPAILMTGIIWFTFFADNYFNLNLWNLGLFPRTLQGLIGIVSMPLIHGDLKHILNNTVPLIVLVTFLYHFYNRFFIRIVLLLWLTSGLWTWVFARPSYHIGSSAMIYGMASFIFFAGVILKEKRHIAVSLLIAFLYGSIVWGIFPIDIQQSWEGHLTGFLAGIVLAYFYKYELLETYKPVINDGEDDDDEPDDDNAYWKNVDTTA